MTQVSRLDSVLIARVCFSDRWSGAGQPEEQIWEWEGHGDRNHDEASQRAQSPERGRGHLLLTQSHVCHSVWDAHYRTFINTHVYSIVCLFLWHTPVSPPLFSYSISRTTPRPGFCLGPVKNTMTETSNSHCILQIGAVTNNIAILHFVPMKYIINSKALSLSLDAQIDWLTTITNEDPYFYREKLIFWQCNWFLSSDRSSLKEY